MLPDKIEWIKEQDLWESDLNEEHIIGSAISTPRVLQLVGDFDHFLPFLLHGFH
jgi:hypothetical protein